MTFAFRLGRTETIPQQDSAERALNKSARTFAAQVEALKRYRSRGDQTVRVEHVTVNEGGQDRSSGLVSIQAGAFILAAQLAALLAAFIVATGVNPSY